MCHNNCQYVKGQFCLKKVHYLTFSFFLIMQELSQELINVAIGMPNMLHFPVNCILFQFPMEMLITLSHVIVITSFRVSAVMTAPITLTWTSIKVSLSARHTFVPMDLHPEPCSLIYYPMLLLYHNLFRISNAARLRCFWSILAIKFKATCRVKA